MQKKVSRERKEISLEKKRKKSRYSMNNVRLRNFRKKKGNKTDSRKK